MVLCSCYDLVLLFSYGMVCPCPKAYIIAYIIQIPFQMEEYDLVFSFGLSMYVLVIYGRV